MRKSSFIKHLEELKEDELKQELVNLYDALPNVREYYKMDLGSDADRKKVFDKAKKDITSKYATKSYRRPRRPRVQKIKSILSDMSKKSIFDFDMIDLHLHNVESAVYFMKEYRFASQVVYNNVNNSFNKALLMIQDGLFQSEFEDRCQAMLDEIKDIPEIFGETISEFINAFDQ